MAVIEELRKYVEQKPGHATLTTFPFGFTKTRQNPLMMMVLEPSGEFKPNKQKKQDVKAVTRIITTRLYTAK
jgi:hypothetical protein